jgi:hypothetical protein
MPLFLRVLLVLLLSSQAWAGDFINFPNFPNRAGGDSSFDKGYWWESGLTFWASFDDPNNPLALRKGTGSLSFTRATTATYVHPTTGLLTTAADNVLRIESNGALIEGQRSNILLWSRVFDNEAWTATNVSVAANQTGEDGVANAAYSAWATDTGGTLCQAVTIASAAYSGAISIKRITGTGTIKLSLDGGSTYGSDVAGSLSTSAWYRASKANQTLANPSFCVQIGTSGDNVAIDYAQNEAGAFSSSRIPTTTAAVTRNADVLTFATSGNINSTVGTATATVDYNNSGNQAQVATALGSPTVDRGIISFITATGEKMMTYDGTNNPRYLTALVTTPAKYATRWGNSEMNVSINGTLSAGGSFDGNFDIGTNAQIGWYSLGATSYLWGHIKGLKIWNRAFTDAELQAITQ